LQSRRLKQGISGAAFLMVLAGGWFFPLIGYFIPLCMLMGIGMASFKGRSWCDWLCPRGSFLDALLKKVSRNQKIPRVFRSTPMRLGVMTLLMSVLTVQIIRLWPDPWAIGGFFIIMLTATTVVGVVLGGIFQQRTWCYLCPIGTMSSWVGRSRRPLLVTAEKCVNCNLCSKNCPMQLTPKMVKLSASLPNRGDCLKCGLCVAGCPTAALGWQGR
jgi:ferredoxin-type protein NapH